jgi:hypothetical protein
MKYSFIVLLSSILFTAGGNIYAQFKKTDSTLKMGKAGYKVSCSNKSAEQNQLTIKPVGFENTAREISFNIKGRVTKTEIDDLNNDGFPDLLVYIFSGANAEYGTVYAFASEENKSFSPFGLPDVMLDGKLKDGYKGHDEFMLLEGKLIQQFPIYKSGDEKDKPTGGKRIVQYGVIARNGGSFQFKVLRTYDIKQ